ncbi:hypothetical protein EV363DRAFT_1339424 [Boletus edulis]|uniref:Carbohydrate-binding module family 13 protein n=1 Tax=Boletus edulis BED1 TaxID=1328754 RepID=A0AAD4C9T2_BOLED|nr:hypothetical protein EV363DRAFT_1339424 [Boletus edulis]KAF8452293.1 hypothetical protein L210DRAFT_3518081 [Boletus edulis BED1]
MSVSIFRAFGQTTPSTSSPRGDTRKRMPIHRGTYSFINRQSGTTMEMASDHTIVGMPPKDLDTQKWEVHPLGAGHSIRNLKNGKYLSVKSIAKEALVVASDFPVAWHVKEVHVPEENTAFYEIRWPGTEFLFELADFGSSTPKTKIHISEGQLPADQQRCRYWKANRIRQNSFYQPSPPTTQNQGTGMGSSFFGFADKWKPLAPEKKVQIAQQPRTSK